MEDLFENNAVIEQDIKRNILSLKESEDLFDDLYGNEKDQQKKIIAQAVEARVKQDIPLDIISRGFHYTTSIEFPFQPENYLATRYGDGTYGCWYGSLDLDTTIYETAFHALKFEYDRGNKTAFRNERAVYNVFCNGILLDLRAKEKNYPQLIIDDYTFTQQIGKRIAHEGHPGLLAPSARRKEGVNAVVFSKKILSKPRIAHYLTYYINPTKNTVRIEKTKGENYLELSF